MNIIITGIADKRPIVYPLLYALNYLGSSILLTNDTVFRRLLPKGIETGEIKNAHIDTTARVNPEIEHYYDCVKNDFEYIVIVTFEETAISGKRIHVARDTEETNVDTYIRIGYDAPKKGEKTILMNESLCRQLYQIEKNSLIVPVKDLQTIKNLSAVFAPIFGKSVKDMKKLLLYKGGKIT